MRDSFVFYRNMYENIKELSKKQYSIMLDAVINYGLYGTIPENLSPILLVLFNNIKFSIDKAQRRYDASVKNGKSGGAPKGNKNAEKQPKNNLEQPKTTKNNLNDNENVNVNDNVNDNMLGCFSPTLDEIFEYAKKLNVDDKNYCEKFYNHYSSIGWVNGNGQEIIDWEPLFKNWLINDKKITNDSNYVIGSTKGLPEL